MKKILFLVLSFVPFFILAQIPTYYNDVNLSLTGLSLKDELATKIITTHTRNLSYSQVWSSSKITDLDPSNSANVILIYGYNDNDGNYITDRTRSKNANGGTSGTDWNREHTYAKSLGTPNLGTSGPGSDAHHLRPADVTFNGQRSSKKFAVGSGNAGDSNSGWYPGDEWKGDVARMMMYMYLRYGNTCLPTGVGIGSSSGTPDSMIDLFLQWNAEDPISQIEINRNDYHGNSSNGFAQGNRNPFIDNPAFATQIWGGPQAEDIFGNGGNTDTQAPTVPTNLTAQNTTQTTTNLTWTSSSDNVAVIGYDIFRNGLFLTTVSTNSYNATGLNSATTYSFSVNAKDAAGNTSANSVTISITTLSDGGGSANELFFSEYVEGSSYNKAVEIANFTGANVDLSAYQIKKQSNGAGSWSSGMSLSGQLSNTSVYVIANSNASSAIISVANLSTANAAMSFNGNDAVGLFKNNVLIDVIGTFNGGSANFGKDQTLRRKETITSPSTTFDKAGDWDTFAKDAIDGLGSHNASGGGNQDTEAPSVPTNLTAANTTQTTTDLSWNASTDNVGVTNYDVFMDGVLINTTVGTTYNVTGLSVNTSYTFTIKANDDANNSSNFSNALNVTTQGNGGSNGTELFISEYVEGSSNNKAIEIVNLTGATINLSNYSLKRNTNGGSSWGTALNLSGQLNNGDVFVVANSASNTTILNSADLTSNAGAMSFNGNDPVGLFYNNILIDIVGNFNGGSSNFAIDTTLRRLTAVTSPNTSYIQSEWEAFTLNTFDGLGSHTSSSGNTTITDILFTNSFETGLDGWIDGGSDCYRINSSRSFDGNYSIRLRDNTGTASAMTSDSYDVSAYDNLEVQFSFYSYSMESNEDFWLRYFDGSTWQTVQAFARGTDFNNDEFTTVTVNISDVNYNFPANAMFRFQCDASSNADQIYMDDITITATSGVVARNTNLNSITTLKKEIPFNGQKLIEIEEISMYPNPVINKTSLKTEFDIENGSVDVKILILNTRGEVIKTINSKNISNEFFEKEIDFTNISSGLYFVSISTSNGYHKVKRIVVK